MSLLNQVLQDLDQRSALPAGHSPVRSVEPADAASYGGPRLDPGRWLSLGVLGVAAAAAAWVFMQPEPATVEIAPMPITAVAPAPAPERVMSDAQSGADGPRVVEAGPAPVMPSGLAAPVPGSEALNSETGVVEPVTEATGFPGPAGLQPVASAPEPSPSRDATPVDYLPLENARVDGSESGFADRPSVKRVTRESLGPIAQARRQIAAGELVAAEQTLRTRLSTASDDRIARELLIGLMLRGGRHDEALTAIAESLERRPGDEKLRLIRARLLVEQGATDEAEKDLALLVDGKTVVPDALQLQGALYAGQQRHAEAADVYGRLVRAAPRRGSAWFGLGLALEADGADGALPAYRNALSLDGLPAAARRYALQRVESLEANGG
jgi:MSHA biogenesis protein MshN